MKRSGFFLILINIILAASTMSSVNSSASEGGFKIFMAYSNNVEGYIEPCG